MSKVSPPQPSLGNQLLARLPKSVYNRLLPHLEPVPLEFKQVLYKARSPMIYAYFPNRGTVSALTRIEDGRAIEVATIGNEGMVGLTLLVGANTSPNEVIVQVEGEGLRIKANVLMQEAQAENPLHSLLLRYHTAFLMQISQSVACNGLHPVQQRCCRWLLMAHDRVGTDEIPLTHEFLAIMLGVRRTSVTEVLQPIQQEGLIRNGRGRIYILDRKGLEAESCECYRVVKEEYARLLD